MELSILEIRTGGIAICTATNPYSTVSISANITVIGECGDSLLSIIGIIQVIKRFHRNQNNVGMVVVNKVRKQGHHYTLHCPT